MLLIRLLSPANMHATIMFMSKSSISEAARVKCPMSLDVGAEGAGFGEDGSLRS